MNYQTANQHEIFYSHKTKLLSVHLVGGGGKKKGEQLINPVVAVSLTMASMLGSASILTV